MSRRLGPAGRGAKAALGGAVVLAGLTVCVALLRHPHAITGVAQDAQMPPGNIAGADWRAYGGTNWGDRFSGLSQITPANVAGLKLAWQFRTDDMKGPNDPVETTDEDAPRAIGDTLYACSPHQSLSALDAATGQLRRKFDPKIEDNPTPSISPAVGSPITRPPLGRRRSTARHLDAYYLLAEAVATGLVLIWNYSGARLFVFRRGADAPELEYDFLSTMSCK